VIAVRQNLLPGLLKTLRVVELYLKHVTASLSRYPSGGKRDVCISKEISDSIEILITVAASHSLIPTIKKLIYIFKKQHILFYKEITWTIIHPLQTVMDEIADIFISFP
jgi:hypothetical protein